jgi:hypothetical protein
MIAVKVSMKATHEPLKRTPVVLQFDADETETPPVLTDRAGVARFDLPPSSGRILVSGRQRYDGRLDGEIPIERWSITQSALDSKDDMNAHFRTSPTAVMQQQQCHGLRPRLASAVIRYLRKMRGSTRGAPPRVSNIEVFWSWLGSFLGIALIAGLNEAISTQRANLGTLLNAIGLTPGDAFLLIGSFGASAVLLYGAPRSPLAQPRNLIGGHALSALIGVSAWLLLGPLLSWLAAALAVSSAIAVMHLTRTLHPPGGATALIAVIGSEQIHAMGYLFMVIPVTFGALLMLMVALLVNNLSSGRRYPEFWF